MDAIGRIPLAAMVLAFLAAGGSGAQEGALAEQIEALRRAAEAEAAQAPEGPEESAQTTFKSGGLGLQALNPEISVTGDMLGTFQDGDAGVPDWDFAFRGLGIHLEAYLDPYSRFKAAVPIGPDGAELGEAYYTRYGVLGGGSITLGKFRQQFGVVNRWHKHGLDYVDFPMPLRQIFGNGGLNQTGMSLDWSGSVGGISQELTLQLTDGENGSIFGGNDGNTPSTLAHYKLYRDLSPSTYVEIGFTGLVGWNNLWEVEHSSSPGPEASETVEHRHPAAVSGIDLTLLWEPTERMRYRNVEWRLEGYYVHKKIVAPDRSGNDLLNPWGAYTSLQGKVSRTVDVGVRFDYYCPATVNYTLTNTGLFPSPLATGEEDAYRWLAACYLTWWQSPFVKCRIQYEHEEGVMLDAPVDRVVLQCVFAAGPHKHERY